MIPSETNTPSAQEATAMRPVPADEALLWHRVHLSDDREAKGSLIERYLPLVKAELGRLAYHLPPHLDRQELYADGVEGLLSAITNYEPAQGVAFMAYARKRIWGAMMDRVRALDGIPRSVRKSARLLSRSISKFLEREGRQPDETELARELGLSVEALHAMERQAGLAQTLSLDAGADYAGPASMGTLGEQIEDRASSEKGPLERMADEEAKATLVLGLKALPDRERYILVLYYQQGLLLKEIAEAMKISESRASQLHNRALLRLRAYVEDLESITVQPNPRLDGKDE